MNDADAVEAVVAAMGLGLDPPMRVGSTIRPETLASAGIGAVRGRGSAATAATHLAREELPQLSLGAGPTAAGDPTGPDLVVRGALGEGGMGKVLLAWQRSLGREVAIKTIEDGADDALVDALIREGMIAGSLEHPVIPPVHALGRADDGRPLLVMKRIEGAVWSALLGNDVHPAWSTLRTDTSDRLVAHLHILGRVADAIQFAHESGVLHRDIKPDNVMIGRDGEVYLVDWGVALRLGGGDAHHELVGTPCFMAPEMVLGHELGPRTDVFLLGATLHVVLAGTPRHAGDKVVDVLRNALACRPFAYASSIPAELGALANAATAADPDDRPATALELRRRIDEFLAHRASSAIADAAIARLAELEAALLADADPSSARLQRLATEAHFGLVEARRGWPDGPHVHAALARTRRAAARLEIRRGNARGARALLTESETTPDPLVLAEVEALEASVSAREREREQLADIARDASPGLAAGAAGRTLVRFAAACASIAVLAMAWGDRTDPRLPSDRAYVSVGLGILAAGTTLAFFYRRTLTENALVRRAAFGAIALLAAVAAHRAIAWSRGVPLADALRDDFFLVGTAVLTMGLVAIRGWLVGAVLCFFAAAAIHLWPEDARTIADVASLVILAVVGLVGPRFEADAALARSR